MERRGAWRALAIVGLLGLVAVVAVAAAGHAPSGGSNRPSVPAPDIVRDYVATLMLLIMPLGLGLLIWAALLKRIYKNVPLKESPVYPFQVTPRPLVWTAIFLVVIAFAIRNNDRRPFQQTPPGAATEQTGGGTPEAQGRKRNEPEFRWLPVLVVGSLVVGIVGVVGLRALRRQRELLESTSTQATLAEVLSETLDDLRRERDPRKAVIGAYTKMVETLAARGVPRRESEAPLEYLERILGIVSGHSARKLTGLFARARYSTHEVDERMKEQAIDALTGLRAELEAGR